LAHLFANSVMESQNDAGFIIHAFQWTSTPTDRVCSVTVISGGMFCSFHSWDWPFNSPGKC